MQSATAFRKPGVENVLEHVPRPLAPLGLDIAPATRPCFIWPVLLSWRFRAPRSPTDAPAARTVGPRSGAQAHLRAVAAISPSPSNAATKPPETSISR